MTGSRPLIGQPPWTKWWRHSGTTWLHRWEWVGLDQWWEESGIASWRLMEVWSLDRGATNFLFNSVKISDFQITEEFENVSPGCGFFQVLAAGNALATGWSLEMSCEAGSLNIQLIAKLGHPDLLSFHHHYAPPCKRKSPSQLRQQDRRRHAANFCCWYI